MYIQKSMGSIELGNNPDTPMIGLPHFFSYGECQGYHSIRHQKQVVDLAFKIGLLIITNKAKTVELLEL